MTIYVVQQGDTIQSIAKVHGISVARLMLDNGLLSVSKLAIGQTLVIAHPEKTYTVQKGDTLSGIAATNEISIDQLLRNNPYLSEREYIYPGETMVISYGNKNKKKLSTNGYAYPFIDRATLKKTLPFLTYLTVFNYRVTKDGIVVSITEEDTEIIQMAKEYGVAPIMLVSTLSGLGKTNEEAAFSILYNENLQDTYITYMVKILKEKGYYGINVSFDYLDTDNEQLYNKFLSKVTNRINAEGYQVFVTINARNQYIEKVLLYRHTSYFSVGHVADSVMILSYNWGYTLEPPTAPISADAGRELMKIITIPSEKLNIGVAVIGYDWELPYVNGISRAISLTFDAIIQLAAEENAVIQFHEPSQSPFFEYIDDTTGVNISHIVWFKDARSINAYVNTVTEFNMQGIGIWNIMKFFAQFWMVINTQYEIEKITIDVV